MTMTAIISKGARRGGRQVAIKDIAPDDLVAALTPRQRNEMRAAMNIPEPMDPCSDRARIKAVARAVATDPSLRGQGKAALDLLMDDTFAGVSGPGLVKVLKVTTGGAAAKSEADKARTELRTAIAESRGMTLAQFERAEPEAKESSASVDAIWDRAYAAVADTKGAHQ